MNPFKNLHLALDDMVKRDGRQRKEIAAAAGLSASVLSSWTSGRVEPSLSKLGNLLVALGRGLCDLERAMAAEPSDEIAPGLSRTRLRETLRELLSEMESAPVSGGERERPEERKRR